VLALYITFLPHRVSRRAIYGKSITLFAVTAVVFLFAANLRISWLEGIALLAIFSVFLLFNIREAKAQEKGPKRLTANNEWTEHTEKGLSQKADTDTNNGQHAAVNLQLLPGVNTPTVKSVIKGFAAGQIMLVIGAFMLVSHGERLAGMLGISETVVGLTAIAVGTSAPELITCIASIRKKSGGLALGNVIGSNIINCTLLLGTCGLIGDLRGRALPLSQDTLLISLPFLFVLYLIAILPMLFKARTYRWQGVALLMLYAVYVGYLVVVQPM
jgi:cation:H+ antiporter